MTFIKLGSVWDSTKKDRRGMTYMQGSVEEDINLHKGDRIFIFRQFKKTAKSPVANVTVGIQEPEPIIEEPFKDEAATTDPDPWNEPLNIQDNTEPEKEEPKKGGPIVPDECPF
ncbi:MAG: hypothetical protein PHC68_02670 [Syntrophorhabdaceae bacterium]|nr:hypothetical protein [Syntrophorhabdaceae bacterium]